MSIFETCTPIVQVGFLLGCWLLHGSEALGADDSTAQASRTTQESYEQLLQQATELSKEFSSLTSEEQREALKQRMRRIVTEAFELRQQLQQIEVQLAREELASVEQRIAERERLRDIIIRRRVEDLLLGSQPAWSDQDDQDSKRADESRIRPGDTITAYLEGVLPFNSPNEAPSPPPVSTLRSGDIVTGYPLVVAGDGTIKFPIIAPVKIAGMTIREAENAIAQHYIDQNVLRPNRAHPILTLVPRRDRVVGVMGEPIDVLSQQTAATEERLFKGEPARHWQRLLRVERDVDTIGNAMRAVAAIADEADTEMAQGILKAARRYGGWSSNELGASPSSRFMAQFDQIFHRLMPLPGIPAIVQELAEGNERSRAACLRSLVAYEGPPQRNGGRLMRWSSRTANQEPATILHERLQDLIAHADEMNLEQEELNYLRRLSLSVALGLGSDLSQEHGLIARLQQLSASADELPSTETQLAALRQDNAVSSVSYPLLTAVEYRAAEQLGIELSPRLLLAATLADLEQFSNHSEEIAARLADGSTSMSDAVVCWMSTQRSLRLEAEFWKTALPAVSRHTSDPEAAIAVLNRLKSSPRRAEWRRELQRAIQWLRLRTEWAFDEFDRDGDGQLSPGEYGQIPVEEPSVADSDGNGQINIDEYSKLMREGVPKE